MEILRIENVTKAFGDKRAVDGFSLSVSEGVIYGLLGPNGAGKTTTIRLVMNIIAPDSGQIFVLGESLNERTKDLIGFLPEERGLYQKMKVRDILFFLGEIKGMKRSQIGPAIESWLKKVQLEDCIEKKVEELSKGMQQKLQFAATLLHNPRLIILDEPFSGLDPLNTDLIKSIILDEKRLGKTIILSTHIMEQAEKLCDNICLIDRGRKVLDGGLFDIKARFGRNTVVVEFEGDGDHISALPGIERVFDYNKYVELKLEEGVEPQSILQALMPLVKIIRFQLLEPSLHNIFIGLVSDAHSVNEVQHE